MPRYRIIKSIPDSLDFRNGTLHFLDYYAGGKDWVWYVRRELYQPGRGQNASTSLLIAQGADELERLREAGFEVPPGSLAEAVLDSLTRAGYAERMS